MISQVTYKMHLSTAADQKAADIRVSLPGSEVKRGPVLRGARTWGGAVAKQQLDQFRAALAGRQMQRGAAPAGGGLLHRGGRGGDGQQHSRHTGPTVLGCNVQRAQPRAEETTSETTARPCGPVATCSAR